MITPQQIEQIAFDKSAFGGYNMEQVDAILEPLAEDYVALYKENALLKSKMRVLVGKLEEYRKNEAAIKEAAAKAKKNCDMMVQEAEAKCAEMVSQANASAAAAVAANAVANVQSSDAMVAAEDARVAEARKTANTAISEILEQLRTCVNALERIKGTVPAAADSSAADDAAVAAQISQNLAAIVGTTQDTAPKAPPKHPSHESTTSRFTNLNLQFGRNYDPTH